MKLLDPNEKVLANSIPVWHESFGELVRSHTDIVAITADLSGLFAPKGAWTPRTIS